MKQPPGILLVTLFCSLSSFIWVETKLTKKKCASVGGRFLSIKDGQNYRENKISAAKFPMYVKICLENYAELRNMYKKKQLDK